MGRGDAGRDGCRGVGVRPGASRSAAGSPQDGTPCGSTPRERWRRRSSCRPRGSAQPSGRWWGVFAPLYALRADDDWGVGSFSDLGDLRRWVEGSAGR